MKITDLFTKEKADAGVEIEIQFAPGEQKPKLTIYGCDGEKSKELFANHRMAMAKIIAETPEAEHEAAQKEAEQLLVAGHIKSWTFEDKCSTGNILKLFQGSPGVFELVNRAVFDRGLFTP